MNTPLKIKVLSELIDKSLNRVEAAILIGDTAINSTVSNLFHEHGIRFMKWKAPYTHRENQTIQLTRYQVSQDSLDLAYTLISHYKEKEDGTSKEKEI